jgi:hypothetical protein
MSNKQQFVNELYSNNDGIYSVYMMIKYFNNNRFSTKKAVYVSELRKKLDNECWGDPHENGQKYSPMKVINNTIQYKDEKNRIDKSLLKYPIIMCDGHVIDGMHRLAKAYINNYTLINAYTIDNDLLSKFLITPDLSNNGVVYAENLGKQYLDDLYNLRFANSKW